MVAYVKRGPSVYAVLPDIRYNRYSDKYSTPSNLVRYSILSGDHGSNRLSGQCGFSWVPGGEEYAPLWLWQAVSTLVVKLE